MGKANSNSKLLAVLYDPEADDAREVEAVLVPYAEGQQAERARWQEHLHEAACGGLRRPLQYDDQSWHPHR